MKTRLETILAVCATGGSVAFVLIRMALMGDVASGDFDEFVQTSVPRLVEVRRGTRPLPLPLLPWLRFPPSGRSGGLGFPDRTDVYTFSSGSGNFKCFAHVRRERVCWVTFSGAEPPAGLRKRLSVRFPGLIVR